jgi:chromosome segregation ATPase
MNIHIYLHEETSDKLDKIIRLLNEVLRKEEIMSKELDDLTAQVAASESVENSALVLIQGIAAQLAEAGTDPAKLSALTTSLKASADALSAAVTQNTPSAPAPVV